MSPEIKLLMMVGGSAMMFHFSKSLMSSGNLEVPNFEAIMNQNPEIKRAYEQAAMNYMMKNGGMDPNAGGHKNNIMSNFLGSLTGDPKMANALNDFMSAGGEAPGRREPPSKRPMNRSPPQQPQQRRPNIPTDRKIPRNPIQSNNKPQSRPINRNKPQTGIKAEIEIIPPADPDNILEKSPSSSPRRTTRSQRDNLTKLVV
jgi:hypothetical protein